jgi:hypothetical protein
LYYGDLPDDETVIKRKVILEPFTVDRIKIILLESKPDTLIKFDLLGLSTKKAYKANPVLDEKEYLDCKLVIMLVEMYQKLCITFLFNF